MDPRVAAAFTQFDAESAGDPRTTSVQGEARPYELAYSERMSAMLEQICPDAGPLLMLAVRAQHLGRWRTPRDRYPMTRAGYHRWRTEQLRIHAERAGAILSSVGFSAPEVERVGALIQKRNRATDEEAQCLEDVACLVFLQHYLSEFAAEHPSEKVIGILQKTWTKMSARGHEAALSLSLDSTSRALVERALES